MKRQLSRIAFLISLFLILVSVYGTYVTLAGSNEREAIRNGQVTYREYFFSLLVSFDIPAISLMFFSGIVLFTLSAIWWRKVK